MDSYSVFSELDARIKIFTSLRLDTIDRMALQRHLIQIGSTASVEPAKS